MRNPLFQEKEVHDFFVINGVNSLIPDVRRQWVPKMGEVIKNGEFERISSGKGNSKSVIVKMPGVDFREETRVDVVSFMETM